MMKKTKVLKNNQRAFFLIVILVAVFFLARIFIANQLATSGKLVDELKEETNRLVRESSRLEEEIVELSSLSWVSSEAGRLGFKKATVVSLTPEIPVALR